jgi:hypothetical protein
MKIREILTAAAALNALDGYTKVVKDGGLDKAVTVPYEFTANVRFSIAKNIAALGPVLRTFESSRKALIKQFSDGGNEVPADAMAAFSEAPSELLDRDEEVSSAELSQADLNLERNPIPPSVIAGLMPLLA